MNKKRGIVRSSAKAIFAFFYGMPILWIVLTSFKKEADVFSYQPIESYLRLRFSNHLETR